MLIKLKCIDNCGCDRFMAGMTYDSIAYHGGDCYWIIDNDGEEALVSTDKPNGCGKGACHNCNGKWAIVQ